MFFRRNRRRGTTSSDIKAQNLSAILRVLLRSQQVSRMLLARTLGVSNATITNLVGELMRRGLVAEGGVLRSSGVGRPQRVIQLNDESRYSIGVHIDVGQVYLALCDVRGNLRQTRHFTHPLSASPHHVINEIATQLESVLSDSGLNAERVVGVGVGASGLVDSDEGINSYAPNLGWRDVPLRDALQRACGLPVVVENNVRAMAFGEALFGPAQDINSLVFLYGRVGVGAGLVIDGQLYHGATAGAGEIGHSVLLLPDGNGTVATLEDLLSEAALLTAGRHALDQADLTLQQLFDAARAGNAAAVAVSDAHGAYLGIALANLINLFNPEHIVLGGLFSNAADVLLPPAQRSIQQYAFADLNDAVTLRPTHFGDFAGVVGSAALALEAFFYHPQNYVL